MPSKIFFDSMDMYEIAEAKDLLVKAINASMFDTNMLVKISKGGKKGTIRVGEYSCKIKVRRIKGGFDVEVDLEDYSYSSWVKVCKKVCQRISRELFGDTKFWRYRFQTFENYVLGI